MAEQEQNRSEDATPFKLDEARKRGAVSKSQELNALIILFWAAIAIMVLGSRSMRKGFTSAYLLLEKAADLSFDETHIGQWLPNVFMDTFYVVLPFLLGAVVAGILINILQSGPVLSFFPLKPDVERINPLSGFKRLFSIRIVVEVIKTFIKMVLLGAVLYFFIIALLPSSIRLFHVQVPQYIDFLVNETGSLLLKLCAALALVVAVDVLYTRWDFKQRMRMSKREIKEEYKRREGDPRIRQKIRELQRESAKRRGAVHKVKDADVLITNPTRLAIALQYHRGEMDAPRVLAKGAGELADQMRLLARRYQIPIVENKKLARAIFRETGVDQTIRDKHFPVVAKILVWAFALRQAAPTAMQEEAA